MARCSRVDDNAAASGGREGRGASCASTFSGCLAVASRLPDSFAGEFDAGEAVGAVFSRGKGGGTNMAVDASRCNEDDEAGGSLPKETGGLSLVAMRASWTSGATRGGGFCAALASIDENVSSANPSASVGVDAGGGVARATCGNRRLCDRVTSLWRYLVTVRNCRHGCCGHVQWPSHTRDDAFGRGRESRAGSSHRWRRAGGSR